MTMQQPNQLTKYNSPGLWCTHAPTTYNIIWFWVDVVAMLTEISISNNKSECEFKKDDNHSENTKHWQNCSHRIFEWDCLPFSFTTAWKCRCRCRCRCQFSYICMNVCPWNLYAGRFQISLILWLWSF